MGAVIHIKPEQLGRALRSRGREVRQAIEKGVKVGAHRGRTHLVAQTDKRGITDRGLFKASWKTRTFSSKAQQRMGLEHIATIQNAAPYAGVIERGARPHKVSAEGRESIRGWVLRKMLGHTSRELRALQRDADVAAEIEMQVDAIVEGIVRKLEHHGQKGKFIVQDSLDTLTDMAVQEVQRIIRRLSHTRLDRGGAK
jgi:hypothetical protein